MNDESIMPFGKHKGKKMADVPGDYLIWIYENDKCTGAVKNYIEDNLEVIKVEIKRSKK